MPNKRFRSKCQYPTLNNFELTAKIYSTSQTDTEQKTSETTKQRRLKTVQPAHNSVHYETVFASTPLSLRLSLPHSIPFLASLPISSIRFPLVDGANNRCSNSKREQEQQQRRVGPVSHGVPCTTWVQRWVASPGTDHRARRSDHRRASCCRHPTTHHASGRQRTIAGNASKCQRRVATTKHRPVSHFSQFPVDPMLSPLHRPS